MTTATTPSGTTTPVASTPVASTPVLPIPPGAPAGAPRGEDPAGRRHPRPDGTGTVVDVMRPAVFVLTTDPLTVAWERIRQRDQWEAVVVTPDGVCVGLLGLRETAAAWPTRPPQRRAPTVGEAVRGVRTPRIPANRTLRAAARTLITENREAAPVVGATGQALGLITVLDLLGQFSELTGPTSDRVAPPPGSEGRRLD